MDPTKSFLKIPKSRNPNEQFSSTPVSVAFCCSSGLDLEVVSFVCMNSFMEA